VSLEEANQNHPRDGGNNASPKPLPSGNIDVGNIFVNAWYGKKMNDDAAGGADDFRDRSQPKPGQFMIGVPTWDLDDPSKGDSTLKFGYDPKVKASYAFDLAESKKLLLEAGKERGFGPDRPRDLVIIYNAAAPWQGYIATQVASNINGLNAGLRLDVKALSFTEYVNSWRSQLTGFSIHSTFSLTADPNSWLSAFGTSAGFWARTSSYDNSKSDALYTKQFQALDPKQRAKLISERVQLVNDDVMWVWIGAATAYGQPTFNPNVLRASVKGFYYNPTYQGFYFPALWKE
jgi:hypothetical protein